MLMAAKNDVTGDAIRSKSSNQKAYADGWDRIFGKKKVKKVQPSTESGKKSTR
jgi:hypothetical protein